MCTKVDYFLFGHKLSWATANFIRCNGIKKKFFFIAFDLKSLSFDLKN